MNRIKLAYLALAGRLDLTPEVREVPVFGEAAESTLYCASWRKYTVGMICFSLSDIGRVESEYYLTCREAFTARPDAKVTKVKAVNVGGEYFFVGEHIEIGKKEPDAEGDE